MSLKPGAHASSVAGLEPQQLLQDFIITAGGAKRQRLGSMPPLAAANDGGLPSQPVRSGTGGALSVAGEGSSATVAATTPPSTEQDRAHAAPGASGVPSQAGRDNNKENRAHVSTQQPGSSGGKPSSPTPAADIITLSDSDDGDDDDDDQSGEAAQPKTKPEMGADCSAAADGGELSNRARKLLQIRLRQNELRIEEAKLLLLQRLRNSQQEQLKSQDAGSKAQVAAKPAHAVGPGNGAAAAALAAPPSRPVPGVKSPAAAFTSMLTGNAGLKQVPAKEAAIPMMAGGMHPGQARPAASSAMKMDGGGSRSGLSVPVLGAALYGRQLPVTGQATSMLSRATASQPPVATNAQASLNNGSYRPYAVQGATSTPHRLDHSAGLHRTPGAVHNGSSGGTPNSAGRAQPAAAAGGAVPTGARSAAAAGATSAYTPARAATQHDAATAAMLAAERQRTARLTHRKHMERIMAQIQPPRPTLRRMDFVPFLPTDSSDGFVYLLGLEEVVKYLTRKGGKEDPGNVPRHLACAKCKADCSPSWRSCDRPASGGGDVVCERCLIARQKQAVRKDYAARLDRVLEEVSLRDRELEMQLQSAATSVGGVMGAATPGAPAASATSAAARSGGGRRPDASEHALLAATAAGKSTPRGAAPAPHAHSAAGSTSAAAAAVTAQVALTYQNAYDMMSRAGIMNGVKKQLARADMQLHLPGMVPMVRQGKNDAIH